MAHQQQHHDEEDDSVECSSCLDDRHDLLADLFFPFGNLNKARELHNFSQLIKFRNPCNPDQLVCFGWSRAIIVYNSLV